MPLTNPWIKYVDRSYQQIKESVLLKMGTLVPEITDHTESNPYVKMLDIWSGISEMLGYYIDNGSREAHLLNARLYTSGIHIADAYDYRVHAYLPATGNVTFTLNTISVVDIIIPIDTLVETIDGIEYRTTTNIIILAGDLSGEVAVIQRELVANSVIGTSSGASAQGFTINDTVVDGSCVVTINSVVWQSKTTLGYSTNQDTHYVQSINKNKLPVLKFGDGNLGLIPPNGQTIEVSYYKTLGTGGNSGLGTLIVLPSPPTLPNGVTLSVSNNIEQMVNGRGFETLAELKYNIPKSNRTLDRAVTDQDHIDIAELAPGVAKAGHSYECATYIEIYIVPDGGGLANSTLLSTVQVWMDERKIFGRQISIKSAGEIHIQLEIDINTKPQYLNSQAVVNTKANLAYFLSFESQVIGGTVFIGDLYEVIENTLEVQNSTIIKMKPVPYARPLDATNQLLNWVVEILPSSVGNIKWKIKFISTDTFELHKNDGLYNVYSTNVLVNAGEVSFTILSDYTLTDEWEFYSYPYFGNSIQLQESSIPVSEITDIIINATGGL